MKTVIMAGGLGTRLSEETDLRPKPMVEIGGQPILWHIMKTYASFDFTEFIVALGYRAEVIKRYFLDYHRMRNDLTVRLASDGAQIHDGVREDWTIHLIDTGLTTQLGGRLKRLKSWIGNETFMMTYGDGVAELNIADLVAFHRRHGRLATLTAVRPPARFGAVQLEGDLVGRFDEKPQTAEGWINGGFFVLEPEVLDYIAGDDTVFEHGPLDRLAMAGQLAAYRHEEFWHCMDTLRDVRLLNSLWDSGAAPWTAAWRPATPALGARP
ncbi:MAG TPA: glucose-1-phosphate cytidylyltransferase [Vicinamibacterales bacterium]|nr:glucose-1-phosphate cytidylyltransferase [Vicinamibacterales bacterium]